jgi:hypothetical protein
MFDRNGRILLDSTGAVVIGGPQRPEPQRVAMARSPADVQKEIDRLRAAIADEKAKGPSEVAVQLAYRLSELLEQQRKGAMDRAAMANFSGPATPPPGAFVWWEGDRYRVDREDPDGSITLRSSSFVATFVSGTFTKTGVNEWELKDAKRSR